MNEVQGKRIVVTCFVAALAVVTWQELRDEHRYPFPARYVGTGVTFGILGIFVDVVSAELGGVLALGLLVGLIYRNPPKALKGGGKDAAKIEPIGFTTPSESKSKSTKPLKA